MFDIINFLANKIKTNHTGIIMTHITIVTCLLYISDKDNENLEEYIGKLITDFSFLVSVDRFSFLIYTNNNYYTQLYDAFSMFSLIKIINIESESPIKLSISDFANNATILPINRNTEKDTREFIASGYYKYDVLKHAIENEHGHDGDGCVVSTHYMWMDFDLPKLFRDKDGVKEYLIWLSRLQLAPSFLTFPGCWPKLQLAPQVLSEVSCCEQSSLTKLEAEKERDVIDSVHWRFCGGFFMGDRESILNFCQTVVDGLPRFTEKFDTLVWDFNLWAWLESDISDISETYKWPDHWTWYRGDHNDSILNTSADVYTRNLTLDSIVEYPYPTIDTYYPTSAAYVCYDGKHLLNTRYVNYWIYPTGCYHFNSGIRLIENKNMLSELDPVTMAPTSYREIEETIDLPVKEGDILSKGLEDIRLYVYGGKVKYIASTVGYSPCGKCRMIMGDYDVENAAIRSGKIVQPPTDTWAEKNWIPIIRKNKILMGDGTLIDQEEELFIYKWSPLEIGRIENGVLVIVHSYPMSMPLFSKIRGSTIFHHIDDGLLGIVHYSEEHSPRHYYHMLVILDKDSFMLKRYSEPFCFQKMGVEFCIGMTVREDNYVFWISRHDRDPAMVTVRKDEIKWI